LAVVCSLSTGVPLQFFLYIWSTQNTTLINALRIP
jgi:hypothetical protein